jgi:hypothetical protein
MPVMRILFIAMLILQAPLALSEDLSAKGTAQVTFKKLTAEVKQQALTKAKVNALDRYFSDMNPAKAKNFELMRDRIIASLDNYVLDATVLSEDVDQKLGTYSVVIRANINGSRLENALVDSSAVANSTADEKSLLTFVFVARQQKSIKAFDDKVVKRTDTEQSAKAAINLHENTTESEKVAKAEVKTGTDIQRSGDVQANDSSIVTSGGSTTRKADEVEWDVAPASEINDVMTGIFSNAGYEVVEADYVPGLGLEAIRKDYATGNDLSPQTKNAAANGARAEKIPLIAYGTLDVGLGDKDPATGLTRVYVTASAKALDVTGRFPKVVASVGPEQFAGLGPNPQVARTNALKLAATAAGDKLMNALNAKGVK